MWRALVNVVMNLRVPQNEGRFFSNGEVARFSRMTRRSQLIELNNAMWVIFYEYHLNMFVERFASRLHTTIYGTD
jgi:hypothetical protein